MLFSEGRELLVRERQRNETDTAYAVDAQPHKHPGPLFDTKKPRRKVRAACRRRELDRDGLYSPPVAPEIAITHYQAEAAEVYVHPQIAQQMTRKRIRK